MKVSVGVITYNQEDFIEHCLHSIIDQSANFDFEIVIGEDGSSDGTRVIIEVLRKKYANRITLLPDKGNLGMMPNFIRTLKACSGEYIALCEGDDYWSDPLKLQKQVDFMDKHAEFSLCFTNTSFLDMGTNTLEEVQTATRDTLTISDLFEKNYVATQTVMYRNINLTLPEEFDQLEVGDWPLHVLYAQHGKIRHLDEYTAVYRVHNDNVWQSKSFIYKEEKLTKATEFLYNHVEQKYRSLARKRLVRSYYTLSSRYLADGDEATSRKYFEKLTKLPKGRFTKEYMILGTKLKLNKIK